MRIAIAPTTSVAVIAIHSAASEFIDGFLSIAGPGSRVTLLRDTAGERGTVPKDVRLTVCDVNAGDFLHISRQIEEAKAGVVCMFGWHRRFPSWFVAPLSGIFFNMHVGDLPRFRGAGGGSWQVLQDSRIVRAQIHIVEPGLDTGPVIMSETEFIEKELFLPIDVKTAARRACERVARRFATTVVTGGDFDVAPQDPMQARYFPRLSSASNAWASTAWKCDDFERFVRAFSDPYPGAMLRYREKVIRLKRVSIMSMENFHPFCAGLILGCDASGVLLALADGVVLLTEVHDFDGHPVAPDQFVPGDRLWTSDGDLQAGRLFRPGFGFGSGADK